MFAPKFVSCLRHYSWSQFSADAFAGIIVGIVAIPLAVAFAIASGVTPDRGLVTTVIAGFLISLLGGSRVQIGGPTGAFVVIVYGIVQKHGVDGLIIATLMAGILLVIMGVVRLGAAVKFVPHAVIVGFTSGIAMIIFSSQVKDFLGLPIETLPGDFIAKWASLADHMGMVNGYAAGLGFLTVGLIALSPRIFPRVPGALTALVAVSAFAVWLQLPVDTIGSRFGELPHSLPVPRIPDIGFAKIQALVQPAITIALLGAIESLLSAIVADGMIDGKHRSNTELIGQGIANIASALFGGIPATGAIARTVTNVKNGGRTPVAGLCHAVTVLLVMVFLGSWIKYIPMACLAGILVVVAYHMSEWRSFRELVFLSGDTRIVLLLTFFLTILVDLNVAIEVGVVLSAFIFMKQMADITQIKVLTREFEEDRLSSDEGLAGYDLPPGVEIYSINGPLFFGAANRFAEVETEIRIETRVRILRFRDVPLIDATGLKALTGLYNKTRRAGIHLLITGLHVQPLNELVKSKLYDLIGEDNVFSNMDAAIQRARFLLKSEGK